MSEGATTTDPFPVPEIEDKLPEAAGSFTCGDCGESFPSAFRLGTHRYHRHGIRSDKAKAKAKAPAKAPAKAKAPAPRPPSGDADRKRLEREARDTLKRWRAEAGTIGLVVAPVPATYIARTDDEVIEAAVRLAGRNAKALQVLAGGADLIAAVILIRWAAGLGVAVAVQYGRVDPASTLAQRTGVTEVVVELEREGFVTVEAAPEGGTDDDGAEARSVPLADGRPEAVALV